MRDRHARPRAGHPRFAAATFRQSIARWRRVDGRDKPGHDDSWCRSRSASLLAGALAALIASSGAALADLHVCNKTKYLINLAVGYSAGADFETQGWWTVTPGACATPIRGGLTGRYAYLYATDIDSTDVLKGSVSMCIDRGRFTIQGIADCWRRGLQAVNFAEVDTLSAPDWTTFLSDPGK
jgi:uncharacterized membrane protein